MKKVLFYCQHLLGIGHLTGSLAICEELLNQFEITFIQGGPDIGKTISHPNFKHLFLAPLLMTESDSTLYNPTPNDLSLDDIWIERANALRPILHTKFDHIVIELFPFGRNKFQPEIIGLIERARELNPNLGVHCSLRDILVKKSDSEKRNKKIVRLINTHFDSVLVHSDPDFIKLADTFPNENEISDKVKYTGYISEGKNNSHFEATKEKTILLSLGGGVVGEELYKSFFSMLPFFPDYLFHFILGPYTKKELGAEIEELQKQYNNIRTSSLLKNFEDELLKCSLSVSMAGCNTVINLLNTKTKSLVFPYKANIEQEMRARKMMEKGLLYVLEDHDLADKEKLRSIVNLALQEKYSDAKINLQGAQNTSRYLMEFEKK